MKQTFEQWWALYWKNATDTYQHQIARSIAADAWEASRRASRSGSLEASRKASR